AATEALEGARCNHAATQARLAALPELVAELSSHRDPASALDRLNEAARVQGSRSSHWSPEGAYGPVQDALEALPAAMKKVPDEFEPDLGRSLAAAEMGLRFARLAASACDGYDASKQAAGLLDFDDLLLKTRELLDDSTVVGRLRESIGVLLVDEFQDT